MAKKFYAPVNGLSKEVKEFYVSVNGLSKKVVKAYCSVNGLSKQFWGDGSSAGFWFYYSTIIEKIMRWNTIEGVPSPLNNDVYKRANGLIFYCIARGSSGYNHIIFFTTDQNAINCIDMVREDGVTVRVQLGTYTTIYGDTWYYAVRDYNQNIQMVFPTDFEPNCMITNSAFDSMTNTEIWTWIMNNRIYTGDFAEAYQVGQTYNLRIANIEKTIKKAIAIFLFRCVDLRNMTHYQVLLQNVEDFVNDLVSHAEGSKIVDFWISRGIGDIIQLTAYYSSATADNKQITGQSMSYYFLTYTYSSEIQADKGYRIITIASNGTITREERSSYTGNLRNRIGIKIDKTTTSGTVYTTISLSNVGLSL